MFYVYIMTNYKNSVLYTGVTNNLARRIEEHKRGEGGVFTNKYNIFKLVYAEKIDDIKQAISREKQIKGYTRAKKDELINSCNPEWTEILTY